MSEPSLRELQQWMKARIHPGADASPSASDADRWLNPQRGAPGRERLSVYAAGYLARIREALMEVYEAVHHVVGNPEFSQLAEAYAVCHPSHEYNLSLVGRSVPEFLTTYALTQQLPFLPDLARLEWLVAEAFHAQEAPSLDPTSLKSVSPDMWDHLRLIFHPSVRLVDSSWPLLDIWHARTRKRHAIDIELVNRPQRVLIFRARFQVRCELIDEWQEVFLRSLLEGQTLGAVCAHVADRMGGVALPVAEWFSHWVRSGLVVRYELAD